LATSLAVGDYGMLLNRDQRRSATVIRRGRPVDNSGENGVEGKAGYPPVANSKNGDVICMAFDYDSPAELFMRKHMGIRRRATPHYRRFATAAEAIRFAVKEMPAVRTLGARMQVGDERFNSDEISSWMLTAAWSSVELPC
jgi:hypothetical protein